MKCHACGHQNREGVAFCEQCGASLKVSNQHACPACGASNRAGVAFCEQCGAQLSAVQVPAAFSTAGVMPVYMPEPAQREGRDKRTWLAVLLGMLLTISVCCLGFLLLPQPPVEGSNLPEPMVMLWESAVERRTGIMQSSGLTGSLLRGLSAILPGRDQAPAKAGKDTQVEAVKVNANCQPDLFDQAACEASGGKLAQDWENAKYCNCPGEKQDEGWCKQAGGSWDPQIKFCSFYNQCNHLGNFWGFENDAPCQGQDGFVGVSCTDEVNPDNPNMKRCQCFCPNPDFASQPCMDILDKVKVLTGPECVPELNYCSIGVDIGDKRIPTSTLDGAVLKTDRGDLILNRVEVDPWDMNPNEVVFWADGVDLTQGLNADQDNPTICWGGCCYKMCLIVGEPCNWGPDFIMKLAADQQPTAQPCCENARARNVKYFRDPPSVGNLFLGFDMQCAGANWQLGGQCASFEALIGASRTIPWTSGECCPDPNYPDRLNCSGSIEGQKKSATKIVMTYGGCTAEAEFQSPYQAPVESAPEKKKKDSSSPCPSGQSMCGGVCCSDCDREYDSCND